jgi:nitrogen fixation-related uncharacterized protein
MNPQTNLYPDPRGVNTGAVPPPYPNMQSANQRDKRRSPLTLILIILAVFLFFVVVGEFVWAMKISGQRDDYKNNVDQKVAAALEDARDEISAAKEKEFAEREKSPYKQYKGPLTYGALDITYPRTWAAYVKESAKGGSTGVDGFFHPNFVPAEDSGTAFALRIEVVEQPYDTIMKRFESKVKQGEVRVSPYTAPKVPGVLGSRVDGEIYTDLNGSMVVFPLRDKTIQISTQSQTFIGDFNNIILPNLIFVP